jgi:hypothetical protein
MLPTQFFDQDIHFAICLFAALVFFAVFWLYFDAWTTSHKNKELVKCGGFLLLALSFLLAGTIVEQSVLGKSLLGSVSSTITLILSGVGYVLIIIGRVVDPVQKKPKLTGLDAAEFSDNSPKKDTSTPAPEANTKKVAAVGLSGLANTSHLILPVGALTIAVLYWRRATAGLERHLKPIAYAFLFLTGYEVLSLASLWNNSTNPNIAKLVVSYSPLWVTTQVLLFISSAILGWWVWRYLTKRFFTQLFMVFTMLTLGIFLITTISFTFLLVNKVQNESISNLQTANNVLGYAINAKKAETLADANVIAENPNIVNAVLIKSNSTLANLTSTFLSKYNVSSLIITTADAQVLLRGQDPADYGDSLSSNALVRRALIGQSSSSINTQNGVLAPVIYINSITPIMGSNNQVIGTVTVGLTIDSAFVDGIKQATGLESAVYAGNVVSATTFVASDGITRMTGVSETNSSILNAVLKNGQDFAGTANILNRQFLTVFSPLKDVNNNVIGMLFIGVPQTSILQTAGHAVELTFLVTAVLLILTTFPAYIISKRIAKQLD